MHPTGVDNRSAILQGTLDLMVLTTLEAMGPMHGYGIARRLEQVSEEALLVNQGTIYLCLIRLVQKRWISAKWGTSENKRKAKFYSITEGRPEAARRRSRQLGPAVRRHRQAAAARGRRLTPMLSALIQMISRLFALFSRRRSTTTSIGSSNRTSPC